MRHLLNTLYVFTEDAYLMLDGENVVVRRDGAELGRVVSLQAHTASSAETCCCEKRSMHGLKTPKRALLSLGISLWESSTTVVGCSNGRCATMGCVLIRDR